MHVLDSAWDALKREFESASTEKQLLAQRQLTGELNRLFRRFRSYENEEQWANALRDGTARFARTFAIFTVSEGSMKLRARQNLDLADPLTVPLNAGTALEAVVASREPVLTLCREREVGNVLANGEKGARAHLMPVTNSDRVVALLFALEEEGLDVDGLELVSEIASAVLERKGNQSLHAQIAPMPPPAPKERALKSGELPSWSSLNEQDRNLHARAQRFARVAVAGMQLAKPEACRTGREQNNIYLFLQAEIDKARQSYRQQFMTIPSMVDYLHLELVRAAAADDERKLGVDYPGHMV